MSATGSPQRQSLVAIDIDTGALLSETEATVAADNPFMYRWVRWVDPLDLPVAADPAAPVVIEART